MAVYNDEHNLEKSIRSIVGQTYNNWEMIIVNDGSIDGTETTLRKWSRKEGRIREIHLLENCGLSTCLNIAIEESKGEYLARADSDDWNSPNRLEIQKRLLDEKGEIDVVGTGAIVRNINTGAERKVIPAEKHEELENLDFMKSIFFHPSVMMRKSFIEKVGYYNENYKRSQDKELWIRGLFAGCKYENIPEPLIVYNTADYSLSFKKIIEQTRTQVGIARKYYIKKGISKAMIYAAMMVAIKAGLLKH